jgi:hypothetical protein
MINAVSSAAPAANVHAIDTDTNRDRMIHFCPDPVSSNTPDQYYSRLNIYGELPE